MKPANENLEKVRKQAAAGLSVAAKETAATARECAAQARRLVDLGRGALDARRLAQQAQAATQAFGERLYADGLGDPALRKQIEELAERRKNVEAVKGPVKLLEAERRGLFIRLAEPLLAADAPPGLTAEHARANSLQTALAALGQRQAEQRSALLPAGRTSRLRVAAGCAAVVLALVAGIWLTSRGQSSGDPVAQPTQPPVPPGDEPETNPAPPPTNGSSRPEVKEHWAEEDGYFPRRRVAATYVKDVPNGEVKCFDESNRLIMVEHYQNGVLHGKRTSYYPSGKKFGELEFEQGKPVKASTVWFEDGQVADVREFDRGILHGKCIAYFANGNKFLESQNDNGVPQGKRLHYLPNGVCFGVSSWVNGQKTGQQVLVDPTQSQYYDIEQRSQFSLLLKDHWR
jgi:hypothetical protein